MNKSAFPLMALGAALSGAAALAPQAALAAAVECVAPIVPANDDSPVYGELESAGKLPTIRTGLNRVQALATEEDPCPVVEAEPAAVAIDCPLDAYGAPLAGESLLRMRGHLDLALTRLAQLRTLNGGLKGNSMYILSDNRSLDARAINDGLPLRLRRTEITLGGDHRINDQWVVGGALGVANPSVRWPGNAGRVDGHSGQLTAYGSWSPTAASYVSAALSTEHTRYQLRAEDGTGGTVDGTANGVNLGLSVSAGYDFLLGSWSVSPYARLDEIAVRIGRITGGAAGEGVSKGHSGSVSAGTQLQTNFPTNWGLIAPHARVELTHITGWSVTGNSAATYASGTNTLATANPSQVDRQFGQAGVGASALIQGGLTLFADYDRGFGQQGVRSWRFSLGLRSEL